MKYLNQYIEDYFLNHFCNIIDDTVPRDYELESAIERASQVEYFLWHQLRQNELKIPITSNMGEWAYEICKTKVLYYDKEGSLDSQQTPLNMETAFKIKGLKRVRFPLLELFCKVRSSKLEDVVNGFHSMTTDDLEDDDTNYFTDPVKMLRGGRFIDWNESKITVLVTYHGGRRLVLPSFLSKEAKRFFAFWPKDCDSQLLNAHRLNDLTHSVILTDSIELAAVNQQFLDNNRVNGVVWVAWLPRDSSINQIHRIDWSVFQGKRIYYLLKQHSGLEPKQVYERGNAIKNILNKKIATDFKFISRMPMRYGKGSIEITTILSVNEFNEIRKGKTEEPPPIGYNDYIASIALKESQMLLKPIIREGSVSILLGNEYSYRSMFALHLAFFISQGKNFIEGWTTGEQATPTLYLSSSVNSNTDFTAKLSLLFRVWAGRYKAKLDDYRQDESVSFPHAESIGPFPFPFSQEAESVDEPQASPELIANNFYYDVLAPHKSGIFEALAESGECHSTIITDSIQRRIGYCERKFKSVPKLLVLDNILKPMNVLDIKFVNGFIKLLHQRGWTVMIVEPQIETAVSVRKIDAINKIRINEIKSSIPDIVRMKVKVNSKLKLHKDTPIEFKCELNQTGHSPTFKKTKKLATIWSKSYRMPRGDLIAKLKVLHDAGFKGKEIAEKLKISHSLVKKLKVENGLSKKRNKQPYVYP